MERRELEQVVAAITRLVGRSPTGAWQPARDRVVLGLGSELLLLVPRGPLARLHTLAERPTNPARPFSFQGLLRSRLTRPLEAVVLHERDRIVDFTFGDLQLHLRLTGRTGGLWLLERGVAVASLEGPTAEQLPDLPTAPRASGAPRFAPEGDEDWDAAARRFFQEAEGQRHLADLRQDTARTLRRQLAADQRLLDALDRDLTRSREAPALRKQADVLSCHLHAIRKGAARVTLEDPENPENLVAIELDPSKPARATLDRLYARAGRLERVADRVAEQLAQVGRRAQRLEAALVTVEDADAATLAMLRALAPKPRSDRKDRVAVPWHTWIGPHGQRVLVGKDAVSNRRLTFQVARGHDVWMHVRDVPGSHLVIPLEKEQTASLDTLLGAAQIALLQAKVPVGQSADVQYTAARNIRSIPGDSGGRVTVHDERVLRVRRDPTGLVGWLREGDEAVPNDRGWSEAQREDRDR